MGLGWILLLVIIGGGIWQLFRPMNGNSSSRTPTHFSDRQETPLDILKKRYARGEITEVEYQQMKRNL